MNYISGLIRAENTDSYMNAASYRHGIDENMRQTSLTSLDDDNTEEEKVFRDNSTTEKHEKIKNNPMQYSFSRTTNSSTTSSVIVSTRNVVYD